MRTIRSVMIKIGQEVNAGDVLFVLGQGDETALEQAKETLRDYQYEYERTALNVPTYDSSSYDSSVDSAYNRLLQAQHERDAAFEVYNRALQVENGGEMANLNREIEEVERQLAS